MKIVFIENKKEWNDCILQHNGDFLQSFEWGEFQKAYGRKVWRMGVFNDDRLVYGWQCIQNPLKKKWSYLYVPHPVVFQNFYVKEMVGYIKTLAKKEKSIFIRVDQGQKLDMERFGFQKKSFSLQPQEEFIIDISKSEEILLAEMKSKTRYNISLAKKHGIEISFEPVMGIDGIFDNQLFEKFWELIKITSVRQNIRSHSKTYYQKMMATLSTNGCGSLHVAKYKNEVIGANFLVFFGKTVVYLHGASNEKYRQYMAPYLLQWESIREAKKRGFLWYNFGGVSEVNQEWAGITRFKFGFSPKTHVTKYNGVWDLPLKAFWYRLYTLAKKLR